MPWASYQWFNEPDRAAPQADTSDPPYACASGRAVSSAEPLGLANAGSDGDRLDVPQQLEDLEVHNSI